MINKEEIYTIIKNGIENFYNKSNNHCLLKLLKYFDDNKISIIYTKNDDEIIIKNDNGATHECAFILNNESTTFSSVNKIFIETIKDVLSEYISKIMPDFLSFVTDKIVQCFIIYDYEISKLMLKFRVVKEFLENNEIGYDINKVIYFGLFFMTGFKKPNFFIEGDNMTNQFIDSMPFGTTTSRMLKNFKFDITYFTLSYSSLLTFESTLPYLAINNLKSKIKILDFDISIDKKYGNTKIKDYKSNALPDVKIITDNKKIKTISFVMNGNTVIETEDGLIEECIYSSFAIEFSKYIHPKIFNKFLNSNN